MSCSATALSRNFQPTKHLACGAHKGHKGSPTPLLGRVGAVIRGTYDGLERKNIGQANGFPRYSRHLMIRRQDVYFEGECIILAACLFAFEGNNGNTTKEWLVALWGKESNPW